MRWACGEDGKRVLARPKASASCPCCDEDVVAKCGKVVTWHWAHKSKADCDTWSEPETPWHAAWKSRYERTEVVIEGCVGVASARHRADAICQMQGQEMIVEFQHSSITAEEVRERELFYGDMAWVVDASDAFRRERLELTFKYPETGSPYCTFWWKQRRRSFDDCRSPLFLDLGMAWLPVEKYFWKNNRWWDDAGLRDGLQRGPGWWQRTRRFPALLEVKKHDEGRGWGRIVGHEEFCVRTGSPTHLRATASPEQNGLRMLDDRGFHFGKDQEGPYAWCAPQLNHAGEMLTKEVVV